MEEAKPELEAPTTLGDINHISGQTMRVAGVVRRPNLKAPERIMLVKLIMVPRQMTY